MFGCASWGCLLCFVCVNGSCLSLACGPHKGCYFKGAPAPAPAVLVLQGSVGTSRRRGTRTSSGTSTLGRAGCGRVGRAAAATAAAAVECKRADGNSCGRRHQAPRVLTLPVPDNFCRPVTRHAAPSSAATWSSTPSLSRCPPASWPSPWTLSPSRCVCGHMHNCACTLLRCEYRRSCALRQSVPQHCGTPQCLPA